VPAESSLVIQTQPRWRLAKNPPLVDPLRLPVAFHNQQRQLVLSETDYRQAHQANQIRRRSLPPPKSLPNSAVFWPAMRNSGVRTFLVVKPNLSNIIARQNIVITADRKSWILRKPALQNFVTSSSVFKCQHGLLPRKACEAQQFAVLISGPEPRGPANLLHRLLKIDDDFSLALLLSLPAGVLVSIIDA